MREMAFLNKGLRISIEDKREGKKKKESFHYEGGIIEFVQYLNKNKGVINNKIFYFEYEKEGYEVEVAMQYTCLLNTSLLLLYPLLTIHS